MPRTKKPKRYTVDDHSKRISIISSISTPRKITQVPSIKITKFSISEDITFLKESMKVDIDALILKMDNALCIEFPNKEVQLKDLSWYKNKFGVKEAEGIITTTSKKNPEEFKKPTIPKTVSRKNVNLNNTPCNIDTPFGNVITPKVNLSQPLKMIRSAKSGETAVSVSGSPIMVSSQKENLASVSLPLEDGTMLNILPVGGNIDRSLIPKINRKTRMELRDLCKSLTVILENETTDEC